MGKFNKGLLFGGVLGAGFMWLTVTKKGRETREQLFDHAAMVYSQVKDQLLASDAWKKMNKNEYVAMVKEAVDKYAIHSGLAPGLKDFLVKIISTQWENIKEQLPKEKKGKKK